MTTALLLTLDDQFQAGFEALCGELEGLGVPTLHREPYPAHVTLALGEGYERVDFRGLELGPMPQVDCDAVATFGASEGIYFLTVRPSHEMIDAQSALQHYLHGIPVVHSPYYLPGAWLPHVTVSEAVPPELSAQVVEAARWHLPLSGRAERLEMWDTDGRMIQVLAEG